MLVNPRVFECLQCALVIVVAILAGCTTSSHELIGRPRPPLASADEVRVYFEPIAGEYEKIAILEASSRGSFALSSRAQADVVIARLRDEAARLGANTLVVEEITFAGNHLSGALSPDVSNDHSSIGVGIGSSGLFGSRGGRAIAIYVDASKATR